MSRTVARRFFERDPREVAPALLGARLVHGNTSGWIIETEAYLAACDPAAHAFRGRTPRTEVLFGPAGFAYVYRTRHHHCLNVAVQEEGVPGCVLIRGVVPATGKDTMRCRRGDVADTRLADGPAKLCQAFGIDMRHYGVDLCSPYGLTVLNGVRIAAPISRGPRVGISVAKEWPLRYRIEPAAIMPATWLAPLS